MIVSDSGIKEGKGYFGAVTIIATTQGAARGGPRTMCSFRAKAYTFLAGMCLLNLLTAMTTDKVTNEIHTDSASLLACLDRRAVSEYVPLGFWTKPDSNTIRQIIVEESK
jgi:hypothetical protein